MANPNANPYLDASVGSRGLTGEGYRGHIFWDELFALPYYSANEPKSASAVLNYRTKRLSAAEKMLYQRTNQVRCILGNQACMVTSKVN